MTADATKKREGVKWKRANLTGLSKDTKKLWDNYKSDYDKLQQSGRTLRTALNREWTGHYPDGKGGKVCSFNVINGIVNYTWVSKHEAVEEGEALFP